MGNVRNCANCAYHKDEGCSKWECEFKPKMTNEDAVKLLNADRFLYLIEMKASKNAEHQQLCEKMREALQMAIDSLKEPREVQNNDRQGKG